MGHTDICELLLAAGANIEQKEQVNIIDSNLGIEYLSCYSLTMQLIRSRN